MRYATRLFPLILSLVVLTGCLQDSASYSFAEKDHAITLIRNQQWFWQDSLEVEVVILRLPECNGGGRILDLTRDSKIRLYQAPAEYAEPMFILKAGKRAFAIGDRSCRFEPFKEMPDDLGVKLGIFKEVDGQFRFVPAEPAGTQE